MPLDPTTLTAFMLARAVQNGLVDQPPNFALSRTYSVIAKGVYQTLINPLSTRLIITYGPGQPNIPPPSFPLTLGGIAGPAVSISLLDANRYAQAVKNQTTFSGPFADPYFSGIGAVAEYIGVNAQITDFYAPTGNGTGLLTPGGIIFDSDACFDNMKDEAKDEKIMVVLRDVHVFPPEQLTVPDPVLHLPLFEDDLFSQAENLLHAVADQLATELLLGTRAGIPVVGTFNPLSPTISGLSITGFLL